MVAVNSGDSKDVINKYFEENTFTFPTVMAEYGAGSVFEKYGVQAFPTNYVIDAEGNVVYRSVGFEEGNIREALAKLGVK